MLIWVCADVFAQFVAEVGDGGEDAARNDVTLDFSESEFYLIEPGRVGGREVKTNVRVFDQKAFDILGLMCGQIVEHNMNFLCPYGQTIKQPENNI